jgi:ABC-type nitrate/sulfonate/bicarbonate transport system permease component
MSRNAVGSVVISFAIFVLAWKAVVVIGGYPPFILPPPESVADRFVRAWRDGLMTPHALTTLSEIALGFAVGAIAGLAVG